MAAGMTITGDKKLKASIDALGDSLTSDGLAKATEAAAQVVLQRFKANVPRDTGALAESPVIRPIVEKNGNVGHEIYIDRDTLVSNRRDRGGRVGFDKQRNEPIFYAAVIEFGDKRPLRQAIEDSREEFRGAVRVELQRVVAGAAR